MWHTLLQMMQELYFKAGPNPTPDGSHCNFVSDNKMLLLTVKLSESDIGLERIMIILQFLLPILSLVLKTCIIADI